MHIFLWEKFELEASLTVVQQMNPQKIEIKFTTFLPSLSPS